MSTSGGAVAAAMARRAERAVVETLRGHGALSADRAVPLSLNRPGGRSALKRLLRYEAVRETGDRYWLNEDAYEAMRDSRRVRAVSLLMVGAAIVIAVIALGALRP